MDMFCFGHCLFFNICPSFRKKGSNSETSSCPDRHRTIAEVISACDHLEQRTKEEHGAAQAASRAPFTPVGAQALQEA